MVALHVIGLSMTQNDLLAETCENTNRYLSHVINEKINYYFECIQRINKLPPPSAEILAEWVFNNCYVLGNSTKPLILELCKAYMLNRIVKGVNNE